MAHIRKGDMVEVISGNDRGKRGRVLRVMPDRNRAVIQGINLRWRHMRKSQQNPQGGRIRREMPVHLSNVMVYDEERGVRTRVAIRVEGGRKVRIGRRTGAEIGAAAPGRKKGKAKAADKAAGGTGEE